ncbi:type VI secretion system tip protein VgrG [Pseudenhygromyxa sp. WMMC2535]|uniref:type VI secretion system Vgr family protein n=1 Tax=Pseudenhygromyxa sp. WMMC2535 TaxID=2712867 RepID=UPI001551F5E6|nr:type VI secretion system tip protein TssI/VgrG [Pseudenhygromyxa sp. WMMC2535]NVB37670.1 type VI secretion system tip protein VgrG [Pseudenhygromyxa sp. WMMC2535]
MSRLPAPQAQISFQHAPDSAWEVGGLHFVEGINTLYRATVEIESEDGFADTGALLGATCELTLQRGDYQPRAIYGVVTRVDYLGQGDHHLHARVVVEPAFALCRQQVHSRIWQDTSVLDILAALLGPTLSAYERELELSHLTRGEQPRDFCVQYCESDYDFACRLLEEEGLNWVLVHDRDRGHEVLTLCDQIEDYPSFANVDEDVHLPLISHSPEEAAVESLQRFEWTRSLTTTSVTISEFDPGSPGGVSQAKTGEGDERERERRYYEHSQRRLGTRPLGERTQDYVDALRHRGSVASCRSNALGLAAGQRFTLSGVLHEGTPEEWLVLRAELNWHAGQGAPGQVGGDAREALRVDLDCAPLEPAPRPLELTPKPQVQGPQTATVVGEGEIDVDAQGRIQVQFHWPEDPQFSAGASCRVRCAQSWAGSGWGAQFIPRVGMEVVVEFLAGNPDRPLVTGCVYNGANEPPFGLPGAATQSGWRSESSPGGGGHNELRFEDAVGAEEIYVHAERDWSAEIKRDRAQRVGRHERLEVAEQRERSVGASEHVAVGADQSVEVSGSRGLRVGVDASQQVVGNSSLSVGKDRSVQVSGSLTEVVTCTANETVGMAKTVTVGGALATVVGAAMNTSVAGASLEEVGLAKSVSVGGVSSEDVRGPKKVSAVSIEHAAKDQINVSAGGALAVSAKSDFSAVTEGKLAVIGKSKGAVELEDSLLIKVGKASIKLDKNGTITLSGVKLVLDGKKSIKLSAKKIHQN